jgi:uncharacterized protein DUF4922
MNWADRLITERELSAHLNGSAEPRLADLASALIAHQRETWPLLREGYASLSAIETRLVHVGDSEVMIQHNPKRLRSTAAAVDQRSIKDRPCFLCAENLPAEEKGIAYGPLVILCNPYPVLDRHLSIVHREHIEQRLAGHIQELLGLAYELSPEYFVLYNGPECGASAPDHLHFQACSRSGLPILMEAADEAASQAHCAVCEETARQGFELFTLAGCGRSVIVFRGDNPAEIVAWVEQTMDALERETGKSEPLLNIIATHDRGVWTVFLFPRSRHRPACFYYEGDERLIVSPGAIDMAGVVVTPEHSDFERLDDQRVSQIFAEVSLDEELVNGLLERMSSTENAW